MDQYEYETGEQPELYWWVRVLNRPVIGWLYAVFGLAAVGLGALLIFMLMVVVLSGGGCIPLGC